MSKKVVRFKLTPHGGGSAAVQQKPLGGRDEWVAGSESAPRRRKKEPSRPDPAVELDRAAEPSEPAKAREATGPDPEAAFAEERQAARPHAGSRGSEIMPSYAVEVSAANVAAFTDLGLVLMAGLQDISSEIVNLGCGGVQKSAVRAGRLLQCRTPHDWFVLQADMARDGVATLLTLSSRAAALTARTTEEAAQALSARNPSLQGLIPDEP